MSNYKISVNQLAEFSTASDAVKRRIIKQQIKPSPFKVPRYQLTKARIKRSLELRGNLDPIEDAIKILESKKTTTDWQVNDKKVSLEALKRFVQIKIPSLIKKIDFQVIRPDVKTLEVKEVDIIVAPEIVLRGTLNGQSVLGGVKIHISKTSPFDLPKSRYVAAVVQKYLTDRIAGKNDVVMRELCLCLDVFNQRLVPAPENSQEFLKNVSGLCDDVKTIWKKSTEK